MGQIPVLGVEATRQQMLAAFDVKQTGLIIGSPGVGKSTIIEALGRVVDLPVYTILASTTDPTDWAGPIVPLQHERTIIRIPLSEIRAVCDKPGILFTDEITTVPPSVMAPLMRLWLERKAGDFTLHPGSWIVGAANFPDECPSGSEIPATNMNRVCACILQPALEEIVSYFSNLPCPNAGVDPRIAAELVLEGREWALTVQVEPKMLQISPPADSIKAGKPWASPRAWHRGLMAGIASMLRGGNETAITNAIGGCTGLEMAEAYRHFKRLRDKLPSVSEISSDPFKAKVPSDREYQIAAIGVLSRVAESNSFAAWVYCDRMGGKDGTEVSMAAARAMMNYKDCGPGAMTVPGRKAKISALAKAGRTITPAGM